MEKSTLIHIACEHVGYRSIEVDASDERTRNALTERVMRGNHKYGSALRPVLPYAMKIDVQLPGPERLAGHLRAVLAAERMSVFAWGMLLMRLLGVTGGAFGRVCMC